MDDINTVSMNRSRQMGYGTADLGIAAVESIVQLYLLKFYSEGVGLSAAWVGIALAVAMIWDAKSDPLMVGHFRSLGTSSGATTTLLRSRLYAARAHVLFVV